MTTMQKTLMIAALAIVAATATYLVGRSSSGRERERTQALEQQQHREQQAALSNQVLELQRERDEALQALAAAAPPTETKKSNEVLKLRGEVGRLRLEKAEISSKSALSKVTANTEARKMLRDQQKLGMGMIYKEFATKLNLTSEQTDQLKDLLADHIMEDVGHVTTILRDKTPTDEMNQLFASQEQAVQEKVRDLLGQEGLAQYQDYTRNLLSLLTAEQFKGQLSGTGEEKADKAKQLRQVLQVASQAALTEAGLPDDYQTVPIMNFRNIASETEAERSLKLLEAIYQRAAAQGSNFLSPAELTKFQEFQTTALNNSRMALTLNRTMMAPISE